MFNIIILGLVSLFTDASSEMVYPLLPLYLAQIGAGPAVIGLIEGAAESLASLLKVFSGYVSDRFQRRKPLAIAGYAGSPLGKLFLYFSGAWPLVLAGRLVDRFGKGVRNAPRDALLAEAADPKRRGFAYGLHRTMDSLGAVIGTGLALLIFTTLSPRDPQSFRRIFLLSLIPAAFGVIALCFAREAKTKGKPPARKLSFQWSALDSRLKAFLLVTFLFTLGNSSNQFLLLRANQLLRGEGAANPVVLTLLLYLVFNVTYSLVSLPAGWLSDRVGRKKMLVIGYAIYGLVYLGFAGAARSAQLWVLFAAYGTYIGITEGVEKALVVDTAPQHLRATLIGLHSTLVGIGLFPASLLAGLLWRSFGPAAPFYFGGIVGLLAAVGLYLVLGDERSTSHGEQPVA